MKRLAIYATVLLFCVAVLNTDSRAEGELEDGFTSLFNGTDLAGWVVPSGDNGHWKVVDGVIDYDARSESKGDRNLKTVDEFGDFILKVDWRLKETSGLYNMPIVLSDGSYLTGPDGKKITIKTPNADSGLFLRGYSKAQLNIWCWSTGSGEVYGIRNSKDTPPEIRAAVTPRINADNPVGQWNSFVIVLIGDEATVLLNNHLVLEKAKLPGIPQRGPIVLQHHGGVDKQGNLSPASSLVQFRNLWIKPLDAANDATTTDAAASAKKRTGKRERAEAKSAR
ncbi:MAG: DUF1080 domain-containing protein [Pirellulaceae bacterium]|nr:DUF1080 domain-containing protein [Pirellulaceae bacterium]